MGAPRLMAGLMLATAACGAPATDDNAEAGVTPLTYDPGHFASAVVSFDPGEAAGFGQQGFPDIVLGPPQGRGENAGSLHVLSLGQAGAIVLGFDRDIVDGPGDDLIVFENAFRAASGDIWAETAIVGVSEDGVTFFDWPCEADDVAGGFPGCAGVTPTLVTATNGLSPYDPAVAGGDAFDLASVGLTRARFVRIVDSGQNTYEGTSGGFDLDAVAVVHPAVE